MADFQAGFAKIDITPAGPCDLGGFAARQQPAVGVHDEIYAIAFAFASGSEQGLVMVCDVLGFSPEYTQRLRRCLGEQSGVASSIVAATHTHSAPNSMPMSVEMGEADQGWLDQVETQIVDCACRALDNLRPAQWAYLAARGQGACHRRTGRETPVVDPEMRIMALRTEEGPHALAANFACHAVCLGSDNRLISADYPGFFRSALEEAGWSHAMFLQGACANINPEPEPPRSFDKAERFGARLAEAAARAASDPQFREEGPVRFAERDVHFPLAAGGSVLAPMTALRVGRIAFVSMPGEIFVELGMAVKRLRNDLGIFPVGYGNGDIGYIPTSHAYEFGGYEVEEAWRFYGYPSGFTAEASERLVGTATDLLAEIAR